jgi:hypothetical protein
LGSAATADGQEIGGRGFTPTPAANTVQALAKGMGDGSGHGLPGFVREELGESVSLWIFDVKTHESTILYNYLPF